MVKAISDQHNGRLDVLVPNAATGVYMGRPLTTPEVNFELGFKVNVESTFYLIRDCYPMIKKSKAEGGNANICVITSAVGRNASPAMGVYAMTKASLNNMVLVLCKEFLRDGIRVNGVAPALIKTDMSQPLWQSKKTPKASIGHPEHISGFVSTICSKDDGGFMNGEILHLDGGFSKM